jgi:cell division septum initiation protein DivIVA
MNPSRIEQAIDEIYDYVENCKPSKLYPSKAVVDRGELYDLLDELRLCAPEEIKRYQKIISNRDGILNQAQQQAESMLSEAQQQTAQLLDQNEIVQTAYQRAEEIMEKATQEAQNLINAAQEESDQMHRAALIYTNDLLTEAEQHIIEALHEMDNKYRMMNSAMKNGLQVIRNNKDELLSQLEPQKKNKQTEVKADEPENPAAENSGEETASGKEQKAEDDFYVSEDAFLKNVEN